MRNKRALLRACKRFTLAIDLKVKTQYNYK